MESNLIEVDKMIDSSDNIPNEIKYIVKAICRGYIRESKGKICIDGIKNVCKTTFVKIDVNDSEFSGENRILGQTETNYDEDCNVIHIMKYINDNNYISLITILTHELGHVITENEPCSYENGIYSWAKRTSTFYQNCSYEGNDLVADDYYGFRIADGFLESISSKIFLSNEFRTELLSNGYDLKDYIYKDPRIFSSRIYDEYKACFELVDYIMDGYLFDFSCKKYLSNKELVSDINSHRLNIIFKYLDESNDAFWKLKRFEGKETNEDFERLLKEYKDKKLISIDLCSALMQINGKDETETKYQELLNEYKNILQNQKLLPLSDFQATGGDFKHI